MQTVGIKELKNNPGIISQAIEEDEYLLISKRGTPIAIATGLNNQVFDHGLKDWLLIQAFEKGNLSIGQLSRALNKGYEQTLALLDLLNISALDYNLDDDVSSIEQLS